MKTIEELIAWGEAMDEAGIKDAMGFPWSSWKVAKMNTDGSLARDKHHHQIFITKDEWRAASQLMGVCHPTAKPQLELFA